jgi:hypothetical protein
MAVAANGDLGMRPVPPDTSHQAAQTGAHLLAVRRLARAQEGDHAVAGLAS